jgi:cysteine-rich repeat protein
VIRDRALRIALVVACTGCFAEDSPAGSASDDDDGSSGSSTTGGQTSSTTGMTSTAEASSAADTGSDTATSTSTTGVGSEGSSSTADGSESSESDTAAGICGDDTLDTGEECDDGNTDPGDGCHSDCTLYKVVFVTGASMIGSTLGGVTTADDLCNSEAVDAGLAGTFAAWISTSQASAASVLTHADMPYRLVDGTVVANDWDDLIDGFITTQIDLLADGGPVPNVDLRVWTATGTSGDFTAPSCGDWLGGAPNGRVGRIDWAVANSWTDFVDDDCNNSYRFYCFEQ